MPKIHLILADAILLLHVLIVAFNLFSLPLIWLGALLRWRFVRNFWYRAFHLAMVAFIAVQALAGEICPLTTWENDLRLQAGTDPRYATSFVGHWLQRLIFYEAEERVFVIAYVLFLALVLATFLVVKPVLPSRREQRARP
jgi:hypothetical protein